MKDYGPNHIHHREETEPLQIIDEAGRAHQRALTVNRIFQTQQFDFNIIDAEGLEFNAKEKLYIAYAVVMRHAFKHYYQTALATESLKEVPNIEQVASETLKPVYRGDESKLPPFVLEAMCYIDEHSHEGTIAHWLIDKTDDLALAAKPAGLLATRLRGNPMQPPTTREQEMARARQHTAQTAPAAIRRSFGIKPDSELDPTRVGCPMLLAGQLRQFIKDAIALDAQRKAKEAGEK